MIRLAQRISPQTWGEEDSRKENDFEVFHHTQHVVFRFIRDNRDPEDFYANPSWDIWEPVLMPVMEAAIAPYKFRDPKFPKAMLAKLAAGHRIDSHKDGAGSNQHVHKIHVPLVTSKDAKLFVNGEFFNLEVGSAYEVNNIVAHGAKNDGAEDRIHFIFEAYEGDYAAATAAQQ
ncbi:aspartyl/asparaginyl beta-hydroxylase domain-containing protein [Pontixanthobacter aquaemixtae]|uniref:Aspartyl beta-hydroxylase n=1 Tax=Pontixanthobacter aquaemixtae TaxID=1958940 RepID=A0A844ZTM3_9SPHN|nr:aspartyl/asparaginyl beta-hydroxylase domain-containing protein [Pontixanthobacter aquaemixtae]MXO90814.1 aspartyl beta-hydroxylase [Pontixanthobacter aquaemixtae]